MSFHDARLMLSDDQAVTATALSTNVIDHIWQIDTIHNQGTALPRFVLEGQIKILLMVTTTVTASGAATVTITLESDGAATFDDTPTVHWSSGAIGKATLVAGYKLPIDFLPQGDYERYLGLRYTVATGPLTAGAFHASIGDGAHYQSNAW